MPTRIWYNEICRDFISAVSRLCYSRYTTAVDGFQTLNNMISAYYAAQSNKFLALFGGKALHHLHVHYIWFRYFTRKFY